MRYSSRSRSDRMPTSRPRSTTTRGLRPVRCIFLHRLQGVGLGRYDVILRTRLYNLGDGALVPLILADPANLRRGHAAKEPAVPHNRENLVVVAIDIVLDELPDGALWRHRNRLPIHETGYRLTRQDLPRERLLVAGAGRAAQEQADQRQP